MVFTSDGRRNKEVYTRIVATKRELSNTAKLSVLISAFDLIFTFGQESWVINERVLSQLQTAKLGFMRRVHHVTLRDKVRSCEIRKDLNVEPK